MNSEEIPTSHGSHGDASDAPRPLGFWLKAVDRLIAREFAATFDDLGVTRREWRLLNLIAGEVRDDRLAAKLDARPHLVAPLVERGWVDGTPGQWRLTDDGRAALDALGERVAGIRSRVAGAVPADDYATTVATLEAIARELGWNEETAFTRGHGARRFHGHGWAHRRGAGAGLRGGEVHLHVHVHGDRVHGDREHGDREHRGERHRGHRGRRGGCGHAAA